MTRKEQQITRIARHEEMLNDVKEVLRNAEDALDAYEKARTKIRKLEKYYTGAAWKRDFSASEKGELPADLPCGVLSEDGISDVLDDDLELLAKMRSLLERSRKNHTAD